jgi:hypothetical protein
MVPVAYVRQYAASQRIGLDAADQEIVLHYALELLNLSGLIGTRPPSSTPGPLLFKGGTACASTSNCWVVGDNHSPDVGFVAVTSNGGSTWTPQPLPSGITGLSDVSCPVVYECWAVGATHSNAVILTLQTAPTISSVAPTSGPVGTVVTIRGVNLSGATKVRFNSTPAKITSDSASKIVTAVPTGATTGKITVTTPAGSASSSSAFSVTSSAPSPTTTSPLPHGAGTDIGHFAPASRYWPDALRAMLAGASLLLFVMASAIAVRRTRRRV